MPSRPPRISTHSFDERATAAAMESTEKTMSVSSTAMTVDQNGDRPNHVLMWVTSGSSSLAFFFMKWLRPM